MLQLPTSPTTRPRSSLGGTETVMHFTPQELADLASILALEEAMLERLIDQYDLFHERHARVRRIRTKVQQGLHTATGPEPLAPVASPA